MGGGEGGRMLVADPSRDAPCRYAWEFMALDETRKWVFPHPIIQRSRAHVCVFAPARARDRTGRPHLRLVESGRVG